ncbi:MAG: GAF domain-containing protein, partial [Vicinamibacteria bacterium]
MEVLYIEAQPGENRSFVRRLKSKGFEVQNVGTCGSPRVVICDLGGPSVGTGLEIVERARSAHPGLPMLVLAPKSSTALAREAVRLGVYRFLTKPVKTEELELTIEQALEHSHGGSDGLDLERLEFANRQLAAMNQVSNRFSKIRDEDELLDEAPRLLVESLEFDRGILLLHGDRGLEVRSVRFAKDPPEFTENFLRRVRSGELPLPPPMQQSFDRSETLFVADPNTHPSWPKAPGEVIRTRSIVISPIRCQNQPIGILVGNMQHQERPMDPQDVARFEMFTNMVGLALDNVRAYQRLERTVAERTESLLEANQELQAVLDSSLAAIVMVDSRGKILGVNRRVGEFFGVSSEEIVRGGLEHLHAIVRSLAADPPRFDRAIEAQRAASFSTEEESIEPFENAVRILGPTPRDHTNTSSAVESSRMSKETGERETVRVWIY